MQNHLKHILFFILAVAGSRLTAQPKHYTTANAHSHNDYEQPVPFYTAYNAMFGSIEADIFLVKGQLLVAHSFEELKKNRSLEDYYIKPLLTFVQKNNGYPFADTSRRLQMMIDVKTGAVNTLDSLEALLKRYPQVINNSHIHWAISGNRPKDSTWQQCPAFIWFDGVLSKDYNTEALQKIIMMSDDFKSYSQWNGEGEIPAADLEKIKRAITKSHTVNKKVRFWDAPDTPAAWKQFMQLGVDYINTDKIEELANFLNSK
ncbi:MAG TPA: phosphatidylinositol-specific phospholipase C/glycerophosphodiester phosphodiesterase family protein [Chitinophagaceae bacterium]|nr:phosphatidylinositol-specific phospholipase C/glycerophosphodiester phosphodiesterase family protein [Chitinophagaceae bacterium]